jgi:hypothetical protein
MGGVSEDRYLIGGRPDLLDGRHVYPSRSARAAFSPALAKPLPHPKRINTVDSTVK